MTRWPDEKSTLFNILSISPKNFFSKVFSAAEPIIDQKQWSDFFGQTKFPFWFSVMNIFQGLSAILCLFTIAKEFAENHFHELSGKTDIPSIGGFCQCSLYHSHGLSNARAHFLTLSLFLSDSFFISLVNISHSLK